MQLMQYKSAITQQNTHSWEVCLIQHSPQRSLASLPQLYEPSAIVTANSLAGLLLR